MRRDASITSISQRSQGAKDQVETIAIYCFHYTSLLHCTSSGIFSVSALSKSSTDARASLCGILRAGTKNLARQSGSIITRSALAEQPLLFPSVDHIRLGYRRSVCGAHSIYYKVVEDGVEVMRVLGRQVFKE